MAKTSAIQRNLKRIRMAKKFANKRKKWLKQAQYREILKE